MPINDLGIVAFLQPIEQASAHWEGSRAGHDIEAGSSSQAKASLSLQRRTKNLKAESQQQESLVLFLFTSGFLRLPNFLRLDPQMKISRKAYAALFSTMLLAACGGSSEDDLSTAQNTEETSGLTSAAALDFDDLDPTAAYALGTENLYDIQGADIADTGSSEDGRAFALNAKIQNSTSSLLKLSANAADFANIGARWPTNHEGLPFGVPAGYSWRLNSALKAGNNKPAGYKAFTGWGQAFHEVGRTHLAASQALEMREFNTLVCTRVNGVAQWRRVQRGGVLGGAFNPDYRSNVATPPTITRTAEGDTRVFWVLGRAYHFWSSQARADIPAAPICGIVVAMQARAVQRSGSPLPVGAPTAILIGAGADYWMTKTNPWVNHTTNVAIANGQLRRLTRDWDWYGLSTASEADLNRLRDVGFTQ